jgi:hypothetical protein
MNASAVALLELPRWRALLHRGLRPLRVWGLPGALGAVLITAALVLIVVVLPLDGAKLQDSERTLRDARAGAAREHLRREPQDTGADPAQAFRSAFPEADERHRRITRLLALAESMGLQPRRSEVRSSPAGELGLLRVQVLLPITGPYPALRRYVERALREDPLLSLDLLRAERSDAQTAELRAELQWSLWMRSPDPATDRSKAERRPR